MNIGVIGAGNVGMGLARFWVKNGHRVMLSFSRNQGKLAVTALALSALLPGQSPASNSPYTPLWLYQGVWRTTRGTDTASELTDRCQRIGTYFACEQSENGKLIGLIVFLPAGPLGHYYTQNITPDGRATGRGDLQIARDTWTYGGESERDEKGIAYRTVNIFSDENHIHYEQQQSFDGKTWKTTDSGDEMRVSRTPGGKK